MKIFLSARLLFVLHASILGLLLFVLLYLIPLVDATLWDRVLGEPRGLLALVHSLSALHYHGVLVILISLGALSLEMCVYLRLLRREVAKAGVCALSVTFLLLLGLLLVLVVHARELSALVFVVRAYSGESGH